MSNLIGCRRHLPPHSDCRGSTFSPDTGMWQVSRGVAHLGWGWGGVPLRDTFPRFRTESDGATGNDAVRQTSSIKAQS
ncbi:hypothetical protein AAFF_G00105150 [Aldrovandia affinis]|uniref:Uncharacterized protein n=1 Tax=Aldrovandia affinis TaxID=143900 RepID=A0AAD7WXU1_9TELE|nr:hypothetical protein AAFF_G00105150 [Aldrovandia affinis]